MQQEKKEFSEILRESIVDGVRLVLGEDVMKAVFLHLGPIQFENPSEFHNKLSCIFKQGAEVLEKMIVKELYQKLDVPYEDKGDFNFERYVNHARDFSIGRLKETR